MVASLNITRRAAFLGAFASSAALAVPFSTLVKDQTQAESPEFYAIEREFEIKLVAFQASCAAKDRARAAYEAMCPAVPEEMIITGNDKLLIRTERETDIEGNVVWPSDRHKPPRSIAYLPGLEEDIARYSRGSVMWKRHRDLIQIARRYEDGHMRALEATDIGSAIEARYWAGEALRHVCENLAKVEVRTLDGLVLKARAMGVMATIEPMQDARSKHLFGPAIADDVLRLFGKAEV